MSKFAVEIIEVLSRTVISEGDTYEEAEANWGDAARLSPYSSIRYDDDGTLRRLPYGDGMVQNPLWNVEMKDNKEISYGSLIII